MRFPSAASTAVIAQMATANYSIQAGMFIRPSWPIFSENRAKPGLQSKNRQDTSPHALQHAA
jgi:hypothetical protein